MKAKRRNQEERRTKKKDVAFPAPSMQVWIALLYTAFPLVSVVESIGIVCFAEAAREPECTLDCE